MRLASLAVLALFSSVALVGCGDDGGGNISISKDATTTSVADDSGDGGDSGDSGATGSDRDALITYIGGTSEDMVDDEAGQCLADEALGDLSADALDTVRAGGDFDLTDFAADDSAVIVAALDKCVDLDDALRGFAEGITSGGELPVTDDEANCAAAEFGKDYRGAGEFIEAASSMSDDESGTRLFEALGPCMTDESAVSFMKSILAQEGMDDSLSTCLSQGIVDQLGAAGMLDAIKEAGLGNSQPIEDASTQAATACASSGVGGGEDPTVSIPPIGGGLSGN